MKGDNMKKLLSLILAALLLLSAFPSLAATKPDLATIPLDGLTEASKKILSTTVSVAIIQARDGRPVTGSSQELGINLSDYTLKELVAFRDRLENTRIISSTRTQEDDNQAIINAVKRSAKKHFDRRQPVDVNLYGENLIIRASGEDSLSTKLIKTGMLMAIYEVMKENPKPPVDFDFLISFPLIDKYGNSAPGIVMKVTFHKESMAKINWDRFLYMDIPDAADRYWEHPAFSR